MKTIKFRAWLKKGKKMLHNFAIYSEGNIGIGEEDFFKYTGLTEPPNYIDTFDDDWLYIDEINYELMQFTGLKDKKGKEIYEGDIVERKSKYQWQVGKFKVVYGDPNEFAGFCLWKIGGQRRYKNDDGWEGILGSQSQPANKLKVVGNIYENPKLLT